MRVVEPQATTASYALRVACGLMKVGSQGQLVACGTWLRLLRCMSPQLADFVAKVFLHS
jgi:hypothetical protein